MLTEADFRKKYNKLMHGDGLLSKDSICRLTSIQQDKLAKLASEVSNGIGRSFSKSSQSHDDVMMHMIMLDDAEERARKIIGHTVSPTTSSSSPSFSYNSTTLSQSEENIFLSILLFPFRLPIWIAKTIFNIASAIVEYCFNLVIRLLVAIIGIPWAIFAYGVCIFIFIPIRVFIWTVTFGRRIFLEDELFEWPESVWDWVLEYW